MHDVPEAVSVSVFRHRSTYADGPFKLSYTQSLGTIETINLLRYTPDNGLVQG